MATQGIVSVVKDGSVIIKAVAGSNGYQAGELAAQIRGRKLITPEAVMEAAKQVGFGSQESLVVQSPSENLFEGKEDLTGLYLDRTKFADPRFNPRWDCGLAEHIEVVEIGG